MKTIRDILELTVPAPMPETIVALLGLIGRRVIRQGAAADATIVFAQNGLNTILEEGHIAKFGFMVETVCAAGESYSIDLQKSVDGGAFASILLAPIIIDADTPAYSVFEVAGTDLHDSDIIQMIDDSVGTGDRLQAVIDYTAGGGATPATGLTMFIDLAPRA